MARPSNPDFKHEGIGTGERRIDFIRTSLPFDFRDLRKRWEEAVIFNLNRIIGLGF